MTALADRISVSVRQAAELTGLSQDLIRAAYRSGDLQVRYNGTKVVIPVSALEQWINGLPTERATA